MSARSPAKVTNTTQADTAAKTSLLKHSGVKPVEVEPKRKHEEWAKKNSDQKSCFKQDFSRVSVSTLSVPVIQPKLVVGQPDDRYEQEADQVAEQVMLMPEPGTVPGLDCPSGAAQPLSIQRLKSDSTKKLQRQVEESEESEEEETVQAKFLPSLSIQPLNSGSGERIQRQADELQEAQADEEEPIQAKFLSSLPIHSLNSSGERLQRQVDELQEAKPEEEEEEEAVQAKGVSHRLPTVASDLASRLKTSRGGGQPLPASTRKFMESRFNYDFSQVRVHTDGQAHQLARGLNAQAFTFKQDVYFGAGYYQPHTSSGKRLLAHELTHTIQQQSHSLPKPHNPFKPPAALHKVETESGQAPKQSSLGEASEQPSSLPLSISNSVLKAQGLISRRVAKPSAPKPLIVTPEQVDRITSEEDTTGPFAPLSTQENSTQDTSGAPSSDQTQTIASPTPEEDVEGKEVPQEKAEDKPEDASVEAVDGESAGAASGAAAEKSPTSAADDPAFQSVVKRAKGVAKQQRQHAPASAESKKAQAAAEPPKNEVEGKAQDRQVQEMDQQKPGTFAADKFVAALLEKIKAITPANEEQAKEFKGNNKINSVKQDVSSQVSQEKEKSTEPIAQKTQEAPDKTGLQPKPVTPLQPPEMGPKPADLMADQAAPKPKTETEVSEPFKQNSAELDQQMADGKVTDEQLANSNEPEFTSTLDAKKDAQTDAAAAPGAYRKEEQGVLTRAEGQAQDAGQKQTEGMQGQRGQLLTQVMDQQKGTKSKDEEERAKVTKDINDIYEATKKDVEGTLNALDTEVNKQFDAGALVAKNAFENYVDKEMNAYKEKRYGAWYEVSGWGKRVGDAWSGLPPEVNIIFVKGRQLYIDLMQTTLKGVATYVADTLNQAKQKIADGKKKIQTYVAGLSPSLQKVGQEASDKIQEKFDQLEDQVNSKQEALIDSLAEKYQENLKAIDEDVKKRQEENKGWKDKAKDMILGVIETIRNLKEMLEKTLARVVEVAQLIIKDPIGFLKNLGEGLTQGFNNFVGNIAKHLQAGFIGWLTGTLGPTGIKIPDDVFSLKGIFSLVTQVLGVSWAFIREKAVKLLGEPIVAGLEKGAEIFQILIKEGPVGLWNYVKEQFANLKETVMDQIKEMLTSQVIQAGVKWVLGLLSPVGAFIKAVMAIVDIVSTLIEKAAQIGEFVNSVVDAVAAIAKGQVSGAVKLVENALAKSLPLIIGFLASLIGVSGIAKKVQAIIQKIRQKIEKAIDGLILKIKKSKIFQTISKKVKGLIKKGKALVKKAKKKAKALVKKAKKTKKKAKAFVRKTKKTVKRLLKGEKGKISKNKEEKDKQAASTRVKEVARNLLLNELRAEHTKKQAQEIINKIFNQLKPDGLKRLELGQETPKGEYIISAEASKKINLIKLKRKIIQTEKLPTVVSQITVTLLDPELDIELEERSFPGSSSKQLFVKKGPSDVLGKVVLQLQQLGSLKYYIVLEHDVRMATRSIGGKRFIPDKASNKIEFLTWNVGGKEYDKDTNNTHAEKSFVRWAEKELKKDLEWGKRVKEIEVKNEPFSPCDFCCSDLSGILLKAKQSNKDIKASISWKTAFLRAKSSEAVNITPPSKKTTQDGLKKLIVSGWKISGPLPEGISQEMVEGFEAEALDGTSLVSTKISTIRKRQK